jgi:phage shock protein PspC (stress-responsive transcriptional regulator)
VVTRTRLRRRTENRLVAGVAGGIADRLNASVGFVRVFIAIASIWALPWVLAVYATATLLIPPRGSDRPDWDNLIGLTRLAVLFGVPLLGPVYGVILNEPFRGPLGWWIAFYGLLVAGGVALLSTDYRRERPRTREEARAVVLAAAPVAASLLALAGLMLIAPGVQWEGFAPIVALVGAATLIVAARRPSPGAFLAPAVLAVAVSALVVAADTRLQGGLGARDVTPGPSGDEPIVARRAIGNLSLDLTRVTRGGRDATVEASVGVGTLRISVPRRVRLELDASVGKGRIDPYVFTGADGRQGFDQRVRRSGQPPRTGSAIPTLRVRADVGLGEIDVSSGAVSLVEVDS